MTKSISKLLFFLILSISKVLQHIKPDFKSKQLKASDFFEKSEPKASEKADKNSKNKMDSTIS